MKQEKFYKSPEHIFNKKNKTDYINFISGNSFEFNKKNIIKEINLNKQQNIYDKIYICYIEGLYILYGYKNKTYSIITKKEYKIIENIFVRYGNG